MIVHDLGIVPYRQAWEIQERAHEQVVAGGEEQLLLVEHPPVITFGRRGNEGGHLIASESMLAERGVELVQSDRGGDITFHGPGQLVIYPVIRLIDHRLSVGGYVHALEKAVINFLADLDIQAHADKSAVGVWTNRDSQLAKICAIGVRIRRGVTLHGLALNVSTDLSYFNLIVPCGIADRSVTSLRQLMGEDAPSMEQVKEELASEVEDVIVGR